MLGLRDHDQGYQDVRRGYAHREDNPECDTNMYRVSYSYSRMCFDVRGYPCSFMVGVTVHGLVAFNGIFCSTSMSRRTGLFGSMSHRGYRKIERRLPRKMFARRCASMAGVVQSGGVPWPWSVALTGGKYSTELVDHKINVFKTQDTS